MSPALADALRARRAGEIPPAAAADAPAGRPGVARLGDATGTIALAYAAGILVAECIFAFVAVVPAAVLHSLLLVALLNHAALVFGRRTAPIAPALLALSLVPLVRLASLGIATPGLASVSESVLLWLPLLSVAVIGVFPRLSRMRPTGGHGSWLWPSEPTASRGDHVVSGLRPRERERLMRRARRAERDTIRRRAMMVLASAAGMSVMAIARALDADEREVRAEIRSFNERRGRDAIDEPDAAAERILELYRSRPPGGGVVISFDDVVPVSSAMAAASGAGRYLLGAYDVHNDDLRARWSASRASAQVLDFMRTIRLRYPADVRIHWVQDNRSPLWTRAIVEWAAANNVELVATPADGGYLKRVDYQMFRIAERLRGAREADWRSLSQMVAELVGARNGRPAPARLAHAPLRRRLADVLGVAESRRDQCLVAVCGPPLGLAGYVILNPDATGDSGRAALSLAIAVALAALGEEVVFRGAILRSLTPISGLLAVPAASLLFAALYLAAPPAFLLFIAVVGLLFTVFAARSGSIAGVIGAHVLMSVSLFVVYPALFA